MNHFPTCPDGLLPALASSGRHESITTGDSGSLAATTPQLGRTHIGRPTSGVMQPFPPHHNMNHLDHTAIPVDVLNHARKLREYAMIQGWGGLTGDKLWALEGIGPVSPYENRIYELEGRLNHIEQAYINSDRIRTEYQLKLEALTHAAERVKDARGRYHTQKAFEELVELLQKQKKKTLISE